jgi:hypothetical protein
LLLLDQWNHVIDDEHHMTLVDVVCKLIKVGLVKPESLDQQIHECLATCVSFIIDVKGSITEVISFYAILDGIHCELFVKLAWLAIHFGDS